MPALADNDPRKWEYDLHTQVKHEILESYLRLWTTILGSGKPVIAYVDAFAGRGRYTGGEPGSPLRALDAAVEAMLVRKSRIQRFVFHFIEANQSNYSNLQGELNIYAAAKDPRIEVNLYHSTFASASQQVVSAIRAHAGAAFFFLDPFGYDEPSMDMVQQLLALPRSEVFVNFMYNFVNRAIGVKHDPALGDTLDSLFGNSVWRSMAGSTLEEREKATVDLYRQEVKRRGAKHVLAFRMADDARLRTLYYLLHATKHFHGIRVMKDVMVASASSGHLGYSGTMRHRMAPLFNLDVDQLPAYLTGRFDGQTVQFDEVLMSTYEETGTCTESAYRNCLKALEQSGRITIQRVSSRTRAGLGGRDLITFMRSSKT